MSDDFERAVLLTFNFSGAVEPKLKELATSYVNDIKQSPECWRLCAERFSPATYPEVKFWCLQTLHEIIRTSYPKMPAEARAGIKSAMLTWLQRDCNTTTDPLPAFLRNKIAQTLVSILQFEYPQDESKLSMHVKDSMREHSISDVATAWYQLVEAYYQKNSELAATVLQTMQRYISWIDIGLAANEKGAATECIIEIVSKRMEAVPKLMLVKSMSIVPRCATWASALFAEGSSSFDNMDEDELELVYKFARLLATLSLEVMESLKRVENSVISLTAAGFSVEEETMQEVSGATEVANSLMSTLFPMVMGAFKCKMDKVSLPLMPFMHSYVARLKSLCKRNQGMSEEGAAHLRSILTGLAVCSRYPDDSVSYPGAAGSATELAAAKEEQSDVEEKRRDLFTLFKNIAKLAFQETLAFVSTQLQTTAQANLNAAFQDLEMAVLLLYELGEGAPEEALKPDSGALGQLAIALMVASPAAAEHRLVALIVMETFVRYGRVLQQHPQIVPNAVMTFLDGRGMGHPSEDVSTRACYLFCRLARTLRNSLRPFLGIILQALQPHLISIASTPLIDNPSASASMGGLARAESGPSSKQSAASSALVDDRLYVFEAVGLLIGQEEVAAEEQASALNVLLQPLVQQIEANLAMSQQGGGGGAGSPGLILQAMEAMVRVSKGFKTDLVTIKRPQLGAMFVRCLEASLQVPRVYPNHKLLRSRFISSVHRMVECLTTTLLPYLPAALEVLVNTQVDAPDLGEVMSLVNQLILRFKEALMDLLQGLLPVVISRLHSILDASWDWSGSMAAPPVLPSNTASASAPANSGSTASLAVTLEDAREKGEVQRSYYLMLHVDRTQWAICGTPQSSPGAIRRSTDRAHSGGGACTTMLLSVFERLVNDWCGSDGVELAPGFQSYAMEHLGGEACVASVLRAGNGLDLRDPATLSLLGEVAMALKLVYSKCGDAFPTHLINSVLPKLGLPQEVQQLLVYHLRESEAKDLKECLRQILQQAAQQQGGK
eukprot:gene25196-10836_t